MPRERERDDRDDRRRDRDRDDRRGGGSRFKYKPISDDARRRQADRTRDRFDSWFKKEYDLFKAKDGDNTVRILPPTWPDYDHYAYPVWMHKYVGPDNGTYICPYRMDVGNCPICDAAREAKRHGDSEEAKQLMAKEQWVCWVLDREGEDPEKPLLMAMSGRMDNDIVLTARNRRTNSYIQVEHPEIGYDLTFRRTGTNKNTRYSGFMFDRDPSPIAESSRASDTIMQYVEDNPIPDVLDIKDEEYLDKMINGISPTRDDDLDGRDEGEDPDDRDDRRNRRSSRDDQVSTRSHRPREDDNDAERDSRSSSSHRSTSRRDPPEDPEDPPFEEAEETGEEETGDEPNVDDRRPQRSSLRGGRERDEAPRDRGERTGGRSNRRQEPRYRD